MLVNVLGNPVGLFLDSNGAPLQGGLVYIGQPNTDPTNSANWIAVFQDQGLSIPLQQPIKTTNGQPSLNGQQIPVYLGLGVTTYSLAVLNAGGVVVMSQPNVAPFSLGGSASGSMVFKEFVAGTDFTAGTAPTLTLPWNLGSTNNAFVDADGVTQKPGVDYTLSGTTLAFTSAFPAGAPQTINVRGGTTQAVSTPGVGTVTDASVAANAAISASKISYTAPYAGAVARTQQSKNSDIVSIVEFGGSPTANATVNTASALAAHATGLPVYYPPGTWNLNPFSFSAGGIVGAGQGATILNFADTSAADLITYTGTAIPVFGSFNITGSLTKTSGSALRFNASSGQLSYPLITNVGTQNVAGGIRFTNTGQFVIDGCNIINYAGSKGIWIENTNDPDFGDSAISNCFLNTSVPTGSTFGIWYRTSGGLKVVNTKILGGDSCFVLGLNSATKNVADLLIDNCSFENALQYGIFLGRDSGTFGFGTVKIANTEIGCAQGIATDTSGFLTLLNIDGHTINLTSTTGTAILLNNVANFRIGAGILNAQAGAGTTVGISTTASCSNGKISPQTFVGIPAANRISNGSSSVVYEEVSQTGSVSNITTSAAYGSMFTGTVVVTFPEPFSVAPASVAVNVPASGGAVVGLAESITTTGFTARAIGLTNGGVVTGIAYATQGGVI